MSLHHPLALQLNAQAQLNALQVTSTPITPPTSTLSQQISNNSLLTLREMMLHQQQLQHQLHLHQQKQDHVLSKNFSAESLIAATTTSSSSSMRNSFNSNTMARNSSPVTTNTSSRSPKSPKHEMKDSLGSFGEAERMMIQQHQQQQQHQQHQQHQEKVRLMNEKARHERSSRVNYEHHSSAKTVREELAACRSKSAAAGLPGK